MKTVPVSNHNSRSDLQQYTYNTEDSAEEGDQEGGFKTFKNKPKSPLNKNSSSQKTNKDKKNHTAVRF